VEALALPGLLIEVEAVAVCDAKVGGADMTMHA
jgi:hypothetical protein